MWDPFGASSTNVTSWKSGPNERGTLNILSTCLLTLVLCVYTCLHLNIPGPAQKTWPQRFKRKSLWLLAGLFAPEFVAFVAFYDWLTAKNMEVYMKESLDPFVADTAGGPSPQKDEENPDPTPPPTSSPQQGSSPNNVSRHHHWTRTHSHYALMGGYVFDMSRLPVNFAPKQVNRLTLTTIALRVLVDVEPHMIPDISAEEIQDKSKADGFTKTLVCIQASWFLAQCIGRLATKHPISLLEMNTLLHALCCLIVYVAWWHKPLDIEEPTLIDPSAEGARALCAWMITQSGLDHFNEGVVSNSGPGVKQVHVSIRYDRKIFHRPFQNEPVNHSEPRVETSLNENKGVSGDVGQHQYVVQASLIESDASSWEGLVPDDEDPSFRRLYAGRKVYGYYFVLLEVERRGGQMHTPYGETYMRLSQADLECLKLSEHWEEHNTSKHFGELLLYQASQIFNNDYVLEKLPDSLKQWTRGTANPISRPYILDSFEFVYLAGVLSAGSVYGGIHLIAWHNQFPTTAESYLWRTTCLIIAGPFPILILLQLGWSLVTYCSSQQPKLRLHPDRKLWRLIRRYLVELFVVTISVVFGVLYAASRIYLVAESFRNLGNLPEEVYQEPEWNKYIPHFGAG